MPSQVDLPFFSLVVGVGGGLWTLGILRAGLQSPPTRNRTPFLGFALQPFAKTEDEDEDGTLFHGLAVKLLLDVTPQRALAADPIGGPSSHVLQ